MPVTGDAPAAAGVTSRDGNAYTEHFVVAKSVDVECLVGVPCLRSHGRDRRTVKSDVTEPWIKIHSTSCVGSKPCWKSEWKVLNGGKEYDIYSWYYSEIREHPVVIKIQSRLQKCRSGGEAS